MNNGIMIDIGLSVVILIFVVLGAKRGLFKTLMGFVLVIAAILGSVLLTNLFTDPVTEFIYPMVEERVLGQLDELGSIHAPSVDSLPEDQNADDFQNSTASDSGEKFEIFGIDSDRIEEILKGIDQSAADVMEMAAYSLVRMVVQAVLLLVNFLILMLILKLLVKACNLVFQLPILHAVNVIGGGIFGLLEAGALIFLVLYLAPRFGWTFFSEHADGTYLLAFFLNHSPKTLFSLLSK